jgi:dihydroneopterin aldolase
MDSIHLSGIVTHSLIGVYPNEQTTRQPLHLDLTLFLDTRRASATDRLGQTVDYDKLSGEIRFLLEAAHFSLLETAAEAIAAYVLAPALPALRRVAVDEVLVEVSKTLPPPHSMRPTVRIRRSRGDMKVEVEERPFGKVDVLHVTDKCGIYRLRVGPGLGIPTHVHRIMEEHEMILTGGVLLQGQPPGLGSARQWPKDFPHRYDNPTEEEQVILCVDKPAFIPSDEILVDVSTADLTALPEIDSQDFYDARGRQLAIE